MSSELGEIESKVRVCIQCDLHKGRKNAVPGEGSVDARVMFVGEGPGASEDETGRPFVGAAGRLLTQLLNSIGLDRSSVFITNIVKCRPPGNRPPRKGEVEACAQLYLQPQLRIINPEIPAPLGGPAIRTLMGEAYSVTNVHGKVFRRAERYFLPLYHPAAALYDDRLRETLFTDIKALRLLLDGGIVEVAPIQE
ncbi:MAG TPA: uracil-DNA glycosylase [Candidatus Binatus sp.]|nr:uracil-DNA glycosylase [Candidatus Binatus sp.]